jgi:alpha-L-fucosidase
MDWWREARFGMFIHWGVYAVYGNVYDGIDVNDKQIHFDNRCSGIPSEWIMSNAKIPRAIYREAANEFDAKDYDPKQWVAIAKNAGMKYIVITAKHHDGFCLFETQYTDWNSIDASAAKRDLLKDLVTEAKAAGLKIGFYYSQNRDWMAEGGMGPVPELNGGEYPLEKVEAYVDNLVIPQIKELTANYDIDILWFDGPGMNNSNNAISQRILDALLTSPIGDKIIYNDRIDKGFEGDFSTPETDTPTIPYNGYDDNRNWESCASLNTSWGFEFDPEKETIYSLLRWQSGIYIISRILELSSKGGNFLLNVGPDQHGNIPERSQNILAEVGEWMQIYGETIYGTQKNELLNPFEYGYVTQKTEDTGRVHWYLHVSEGYWAEKEIVLTGVTELPVSATLFETKEPLNVKLRDNDLIITLPDNSPNPFYSSVDLCFAKKPDQIVKSAIRNDQIRLTPFQAEVKFLKKDFIPYALKSWYYKYSEIEFNVYLEKGEYTFESEYACWHDEGEIYLKCDDMDYTLPYKATGDMYKPNDLDNFITDDFGGVKIYIPQSKKYSIKLRRNAEIPNITNWINVRSFVFKTNTTYPIDTIMETYIYPNPVKNGYFICETPIAQIFRIYDLLGYCHKMFFVEEKTSQYVDVSNFKPGIYIVKGENFIQKIIINKL